MDIRQYNTIKKGEVSMYHCGPTVYDFPTIGNMRSYVFADTLRRGFEYFDTHVKQVINITDVGHLVGDSDEGEDKIEKSAKKEGKTAEEVARFFEDLFYDDLKDLNIETEDTVFPRATLHIKEQIEIIEILEKKDLIYKTSDGIYFDTGKYPEYGKLGGVNKKEDSESRIGENSEKKNPADFALWKFSKPEDKRLQEWPSPWGVGFPGWHIECSAMSRTYLGQPFDIHTGGVDHISVHHNNEIAQSEAAYGVPLANTWLHNEFLRVDNEKMSKSLGNTYTINDLKMKKVHPLSFRYWLLTGKYNTPMNFTFEAVQASQNTLEKIVAIYSELTEGDVLPQDPHEDIKQFEDAISDDLNTPIMIALLQKATHRKTIDKMDKVLGLNIAGLNNLMRNIPSHILDLQKQRETARENEDWKLSDDLRDKIEHAGYIVKDSSSRTTLLKSLSLITTELLDK